MGLIISSPLQGIDWIAPVLFSKGSKAQDITDHLYFISQSGIISCALCWWNEITWSYSQRLNSHGTHITDIYLAIGRHNLKVDEPIHHWSEPFLSAVPGSYCRKQVTQARGLLRSLMDMRKMYLYAAALFCMCENIFNEESKRKSLVTT